VVRSLIAQFKAWFSDVIRRLILMFLVCLWGKTTYFTTQQHMILKMKSTWFPRLPHSRNPLKNLYRHPIKKAVL